MNRGIAERIRGSPGLPASGRVIRPSDTFLGGSRPTSLLLNGAKIVKMVCNVSESAIEASVKRVN